MGARIEPPHTYMSKSSYEVADCAGSRSFANVGVIRAVFYIIRLARIEPPHNYMSKRSYVVAVVPLSINCTGNTVFFATIFPSAALSKRSTALSAISFIG